MIFIDLHLNPEEQGKDLNALLKKYASNIDYVFHLSSAIQPIFVQHGLIPSKQKIQNCEFIVKNGKPNFFYYLFLFFEIRRLMPDALMLHGFLKPLYLLILRLILPRRAKLIIQNHADLPLKGHKKYLQQMAAKYIDGFLFVAQEQAKPWIRQKIITNEKKIFTIMEGSSSFTYVDKHVAKQKIQCKEDILFLWVGRLDENKDPLTVLQGFSKYFQEFPNQKLLMIHGADNLLKEVKQYIEAHQLQANITIKANVPHEQMAIYYQAADYFVLASQYEGSGYALCEAMACGTVPIVTNIPSFRSMTNDGQLGHLFEPGNSDMLREILLQLNHQKLPLQTKANLQKFAEDLSFQAIGRDLSNILLNLR